MLLVSFLVVNLFLCNGYNGVGVGSWNATVDTAVAVVLVVVVVLVLVVDPVGPGCSWSREGERQ